MDAGFPDSLNHSLNLGDHGVDTRGQFTEFVLGFHFQPSGQIAGPGRHLLDTTNHRLGGAKDIPGHQSAHNENKQGFTTLR